MAMPYYTDEQLANTPSRQQGVGADAEAEHRRSYCALVWNLCQQLLMCVTHVCTAGIRASTCAAVLLACMPKLCLATGALGH